jgi:hypothetical protein
MSHAQQIGDPTWDAWLVLAWPALLMRQRLALPPRLAHPREVGFTAPPLAEPAGQVADFVRSLEDGSRLHVHEYPGGRLKLHRDRIDPARGVSAAAWHWTTEAPSARAALALAVAVLLVSRR